MLLEDGSESVMELTDDFDVDTKDLKAVKEKLAAQGVTGEGGTGGGGRG